MKLVHIQNPVPPLFIANVVPGNDGAPAEFGRERKWLIELHLTHWSRQCVSSLPHPEPAQARYAHPHIWLSHLIHIRNPVPHIFLVLEGDNLFIYGPLICVMTHEHVALPYPETSTHFSCEHVVPDCSRGTSWAVTHPYVGVCIAGPMRGEWFEGSHKIWVTCLFHMCDMTHPNILPCFSGWA